MNPDKKSPADKLGNETTKIEYTTQNQAKVSFFNSFSDRKPKDIWVPVLVDSIRSGRWAAIVNRLRKLKQANPKAYSKDKLILPFFTMAGTFSERLKRSFLNPSGYIILDIDNLPLETLRSARAVIESNPYTAICFLSPSGVGLKVAFRVAINNDAECKAAFSEIGDYFKSEYQIELDHSGKDISRACFVSYDPDIYHNPAAAIFPYSVPSHEPETARVEQLKVGFVGSKVEKYVLRAINGELERIVAAGRGQGNNALNTAAMKVAQFYHLGLFDKEPVKDHFVRAYMQRGGSYKNQIEAGNTFESGWNTGVNEPRSISEGG